MLQLKKLLFCNIHATLKNYNLVNNLYKREIKRCTAKYYGFILILKNKNFRTPFFDDIISRYGSHGNSRSIASSYNNYQNRDDRRQANAKDIKKMSNNVKALNKAVSELYFSDGEYANLSFRGITAIKVSFVFSDLRNCDFSNTILKNCDFTFANLKNSNFTGATISECLFRHSDIRNCNFTDTDISFCDFTGTHYDCRYS